MNRPWSKEAWSTVTGIMEQGRYPTYHEQKELMESEGKSMRSYANLVYSVEQSLKTRKGK